MQWLPNSSSRSRFVSISVIISMVMSKSQSGSLLTYMMAREGIGGFEREGQERRNPTQSVSAAVLSVERRCFHLWAASWGSAAPKRMNLSGGTDVFFRPYYQAQRYILNYQLWILVMSENCYCTVFLQYISIRHSIYVHVYYLSVWVMAVCSMFSGYCLYFDVTCVFLSLWTQK